MLEFARKYDIDICASHVIQHSKNIQNHITQVTVDRWACIEIRAQQITNLQQHPMHAVGTRALESIYERIEDEQYKVFYVFLQVRRTRKQIKVTNEENYIIVTTTKHNSQKLDDNTNNNI